MDSGRPSSLLKSYDPANFSNGVYVHSQPENADFYDLLWQHQSGSDHVITWGQDRLAKFLRFLGGQRYWPKSPPIVLDIACGLGRFSIASLELGADYVIACDGSNVGPKFIYDLVNKGNKHITEAGAGLPTKNSFRDKILPVQLDIEKISQCFKQEAFDLVFIHMAMHHVRDYQETLTDLSRLVSPDGYLCANYFVIGTTSAITRKLREIFLHEPMNKVRDFLLAMHRIETGAEKENAFEFSKFLDEPSCLPEYESYRVPLTILVSEFGKDQVYDHLRWEDMQTPYLHNFDHAEVLNFIRRDLHFKLVNESKGRFLARKPRRGIWNRIF